MPYNTSRTIELPCVAAALLWGASVGLFALAVVLGATVSDHAANLTIGAAVIVTGMACCATVRVMLRDHYRAMQAVFDYGREVGQEEGATIPLQRVH